MFSPHIIEITNNFPENIRQDIDSIINDLDYNPIWQTIEWQLMLWETGYTNKSFFVWVYKETELLSYVLVEKRDIGWWQTGFFCIGGPVIEDENSTSLLSKTLQELSLQEKVTSIQIEPLSLSILPDFKTDSYKDFIEKHTALIDLTQNNESILARMKPKGRYNIRVAEKSNVEVEQVSYNEENLDVFYSLLGETLERDGFAANSREYFRTFLQYLETYNLGGIFFATREGEVIAGGIFIFYKKTALYYYGASSSDNTKRKYMASYLLQWKALEEAKKRGCEIFDFLGISSPDELNSHLAGVTDFKLKLTNETKQWPDTQILVLKKCMYMLLKMKKVVKIWRNTISRL